MGFRLGPRFSNALLESAFAKQQDAAHAKIDSVVFGLWASVWFMGAAALGVRGLFGVVHYGLLGAVAWLVAWVLQQWAPDLYLEHRRLWVSVIRLCAIFLPCVADVFGRLPAHMQLKPSHARLACAIALAAQLETAWLLTFGLRLDFSRSVALQLALAVGNLLVQAPKFCRTGYVNHSASQEQFRLASHGLTQLCLPAVVTTGPSGKELEGPAQWQCCAVVATTHVVLGLLLPSAAVYIREQGERAGYLRRLAAATPPGSAGGGRSRLPLPHHEMLAVCTFDPMASWATFFALLPALAAGAWFAALALYVRCLPSTS